MAQLTFVPSLLVGQGSIQLLLVTCALIAVPWMLLAKPYLLRRRHRIQSGYKTVKGAERDGSSRRLMDDDGNSSDVSDMYARTHYTTLSATTPHTIHLPSC